MASIRISIIMPFFNRISLVVQSIHSVLAQTYSNWELIMINDGSTEDISPILYLTQQDPRLKLYTIMHQGTSYARNIGLFNATGSYIAFLDSDDLFKPTKLEKQLQFMLIHQYAFCHTSYERIDIDGYYLSTQDTGTLNGHVFTTLIRGCAIATPTVMVKTDAIRDKSFITHYTVSEDICFWMDVAFEYELGGIPEALSEVRFTPLTTANDPAKCIQGRANQIDHLLSIPKYLPYIQFLK